MANGKMILSRQMQMSWQPAETSFSPWHQSYMSDSQLLLSPPNNQLSLFHNVPLFYRQERSGWFWPIRSEKSVQDKSAHTRYCLRPSMFWKCLNFSKRSQKAQVCLLWSLEGGDGHGCPMETAHDTPFMKQAYRSSLCPYKKSDNLGHSLTEGEAQLWRFLIQQFSSLFCCRCVSRWSQSAIVGKTTL